MPSPKDPPSAKPPRISGLASPSLTTSIGASVNDRVRSDFISISDLEDRWLCSRRHVERIIQQGHLPKHKVGKRTLLRRRDVFAYERRIRRQKNSMTRPG